LSHFLSLSASSPLGFQHGGQILDAGFADLVDQAFLFDPIRRMRTRMSGGVRGGR
jgi:hypothetical protein